MISELILDFIYTIYSAIFNLLPNVTIADIPSVGPFISTNLTLAVTKWNAFLITFPYAVVVWFCFKLIIVFELLLLTARFILGSRLPVAHSS